MLFKNAAKKQLKTEFLTENSFYLCSIHKAVTQEVLDESLGLYNLNECY